MASLGSTPGLQRRLETVYKCSMCGVWKVGEARLLTLPEALPYHTVCEIGGAFSWFGRALSERRRAMEEVAALSLDAFSRCTSPGSTGRMYLPEQKEVAACQTIASMRT